MQPALSLTLAAVPFSVAVLAAAFAITCLFLMLVVLVQKPKGGGLSGAFGGAGGGEGALMGAKVGDFLTWTTVGLFVLFILFAMLLTWTIHPKPAPITAQNVTSPAGLGETATTEGDEATEELVVPEDDATATDADTESTTETPTDSPAPAEETNNADDAS